MSHSRASAGPEPLRASQLAELAAAIGGGGSVAGVRRLAGGLSSWVHPLEMRTGRRRHRVVLRRYRPHSSGTATRAERESKILALLAGTGLPTPEPLWSDPHGGLFGR